MAYIRTCVQNLGAIRRPVRKTCLLSLIIDSGWLQCIIASGRRWISGRGSVKDYESIRISN